MFGYPLTQGILNTSVKCMHELYKHTHVPSSIRNLLSMKLVVLLIYCPYPGVKQKES